MKSNGLKLSDDGKTVVRVTYDSIQEIITIPDSVTSIGDEAFQYCKSLKSIIIPNSVTSIGDGAFFGCTSLKNIDIPNSVTSIRDRTFNECI